MTVHKKHCIQIAREGEFSQPRKIKMLEKENVEYFSGYFAMLHKNLTSVSTRIWDSTRTVRQEFGITSLWQRPRLKWSEASGMGVTDFLQVLRRQILLK